MNKICIKITITIIISYIIQHINSQEFSDYYDTGIPSEQEEGYSNVQIPKKQNDVNDQITARDLLVYLNLNGGEKEPFNKQEGIEEPEYIEYENPPIQDSRYTKQPENYGDYFDDLTEGNQEFRKSRGKFSKNEKDNSFKKGFDTPLANLYHQLSNSTIQRYARRRGFSESSEPKSSRNFRQNFVMARKSFNGDGTLNLHQSTKIPAEIPMKTYQNIDRNSEGRRRVDDRTKPVSCITSSSPTLTLPDKDSTSFHTDSSVDHKNMPYYLSNVKRRKYESETVFRNERDGNAYLDRLKDEFYKQYNSYILAVNAYYRKSDARHVENVKKIYNKILQSFGKYFTAFKEVNPNSSIPKSVTNSMIASEKVERYFKSDKWRKNLRRSFATSETIKSVTSYQQAKRNYLLAVKYYLKALKLYEKNPTNVYFQNAVNSYKIVLDTHGVYRKEYKRNYRKEQSEDSEFEGRVLKETEMTEPPIPLPEDPSSSDAESYQVARLNYLEWMLLYLKSLISFYERQDGVSELTITTGYDKLRSRFDEYQKFYERLISHDALPEEEKKETFIKLLDAPVLDRSITEIKDQDIPKKLRQHDQARLFYYKQLLEYMSELWYVYSADNRSKQNRLITALNEYKKLNDFRKIYHGVYLYIYDHKLTNSARYPFPNTPDLFTTNSRLPVKFKVEDFSNADFLLLTERTERKRNEYRRLVDSYAEDPRNEVLYRTAVVSYEDLERTYAFQDYIYRRQSSLAKYDKPPLIVDLKAEIEKLKMPKFMVLPAPVDPKEQAEQLSRETRPEVLSEKIKQLEAEYSVSLLIYNALSDLLQGHIKNDTEELVIDFELASYNRTLNLLFDLCNHLNEFLDRGNGKCIMPPLPKSNS